MEEIYSKTTNPPPLASGGREIIPSGEYTCKFMYNSSLSHVSGTGNYLVSDTFMTNSEYSWAIYFYPNGKRVERDGNLVSFVIQMESKPNNQQDKALFKLVLVDQRRKRNHKIHIHSGLAHQGCHLEEHGSEEYAKDGFIQVFCWIAIFGLPCISNSEDQSSLFMETLISKETAYSVIINTESLLRPRRSLLFGAYHYKIDEYLKAIDKIQELMKSGMITNYQSEGINVMDMVMKRLQLEFKEILKYPTNKIKNHMHISETSTSYSSSVSSSSYELHDTDSTAHGEFSDQQVIHLCNIIARLKISKGLIGHCIDQYRISRKSVVDATFSRFGIQKCGIRNIWSSDWEQVMVRMKLWIRAINVCSRIIFPREKKYYEQIFAGIESATYDDCFLTIITDAAIQLCNFAKIISITTPVSLQKLFGVLDLYRALLLLLSEIKATFHSSSSVNVYSGAAKIVDRLAELVRQIISAFEDTVLNEQLTTLPGCIIHPLTTYSMDYVLGMLTYKELLTEIIISKPTISLGISDDDMQFLEVGGKTPFALHLVWIFIILKFNLEGKSKQFVDASMGHLFMIKNVKLIVAKVEQYSELLEMIGEDYLTMLCQYVARKAITYVESLRDKALHGLRDEGLNHKFLLFNRISKSALKKRLKIFNAMLEDFFGIRTWLVPDLQLQGQLDKLMFEELIPAYESFLVKYRRHVESEKDPEKYIKYLPEDLKDELDGKRKVFSTIK